jgi:hypothetical protein
MYVVVLQKRRIILIATPAPQIIDLRLAHITALAGQCHVSQRQAQHGEVAACLLKLQEYLEKNKRQPKQTVVNPETALLCIQIRTFLRRR